jgi:hypothetical protein
MVVENDRSARATPQPAAPVPSRYLSKAERDVIRNVRSYGADLPSISYSEELHKSSQVFLDSYLPSKTLHTQFARIRVYNPLSAKSDEFPDLVGLSFAWNKICAEGRSTISEVDKLAEQFNFLSGKWLVFASRDKVDNLWGRVAESTLAGTLGNSATGKGLDI